MPSVIAGRPTALPPSSRRQGVVTLIGMVALLVSPILQADPHLWAVRADGEPLAIVLSRFARTANVEVFSRTPLRENVTIDIENGDVDAILHHLLRNHSYIHRASPTKHELWILGEARARDLRYSAHALTSIESGREVTEDLVSRDLFSTDPRLRIETAVQLANGDEAGVPWLQQQLGDSDQRVRIAAIEALSSIGGDHATRLLGAALFDSDPVIQEFAANALADIGGVEAIAELRGAQNDPNDDLRELVADLINESELP